MSGLEAAPQVVLGSLGLGLLIGFGLPALLRRERAQPPVLPGPVQPVVTAGERAPEDAGRARRVLAALESWLRESSRVEALWPALDQIVREVLTEHVGATRVRCFQVPPGAKTLQGLVQGSGEAVGPSAREGVLGYVATSGKEYYARDRRHGALVDDLAARADATWAWVWPVQVDGVTAGVVAVGALREPALLDGDLRPLLGLVLTAYWRHVACLLRLRVERRTDQASGVLTRSDFFALAGHALADSYRENEPVVVAVLALEGLRRLDDTGRWQERDRLIEDLGRAVAQRVRSDDLVGRFADDRFVLLLRRLDSGLGRLIAEKLLHGAQERVARLGLEGEAIRLRAGLAGSGLAQPALAQLLAAGFDAVEQARRENVVLKTDLEGGMGEGVGP